MEDVLSHPIDLFVELLVVDDSYESLIVGVDLDIGDIKEYCLLPLGVPIGPPKLQPLVGSSHVC